PTPVPPSGRPPTTPGHLTLPEAHPAVSVVIPCYDQAEYLAEAVESVVGQTYVDWEIVIVDDGSPDDAAVVADGLSAAHPDRRIRLIRQANAGLAAARNAGIAASSGRYILPLDADDLLMKEMLEKTVRLLDAEPGVAIAYTDQRQFGAVSRIVKTAEWDTDLQRRRNLFAATALFRREVWYAVGGYDPAMRDGYEDWDFWLAAAERGFVGRRIPEALFGYRIKASSMHVTARAGHRDLVEQIRAKHPEWYASSWRRWWRWPIRAWRRLRHVIGTALRPAGR
ncbi:MAG TPA: glycosyltransferase family A protein, partial [Candidatus Eisenbacteria bacterium]|nr:glycosyltransferase family A protein [Candidatus Eisenbacteria bacterium]